MRESRCEWGWKWGGGILKIFKTPSSIQPSNRRHLSPGANLSSAIPSNAKPEAEEKLYSIDIRGLLKTLSTASICQVSPSVTMTQKTPVGGLRGGVGVWTHRGI